MPPARRPAGANAEAVARMTGAEPVLIDVQPALDVIPGMTPNTILTSGPPLPWPEYYGGQRRAVVYGAIYEGLAADEAYAEAKLRDSRIILSATHDHNSVSSVAGIYTASMPVFVVENTERATGLTATSTRASPAPAELRFVQRRGPPRPGFPPRRPGARAAGRDRRFRWRAAQAAHRPSAADERRAAQPEHSRHHPADQRTDAAVRGIRRDQLEGTSADRAELLLRQRLLLPAAVDGGRQGDGRRRPGRPGGQRRHRDDDQLPELRDPGQQLGDEWFLGPLPEVSCKLFDGFTDDDVQWIGGESHIT